MSTKTEILNLTRESLATELSEKHSLEPFRAQQLYNWIYPRRLTSFEPMLNISKVVREELGQNYNIYRPKEVTVQQSKDGTRKYLFALPDGSQVESVLIKQPKRYTLCVSSQVGCAIGCTFCRTGLMGLKRNLEAYEIVSQVLAVKDDIARLQKESPDNAPEDFYNIVFMGMGEPLHNYDNVVKAICILNDNLGLDFSGRKITVSTSGLVPAIEKFGKSDAKANLAISLNATTDEVRTKLIPINKKWPLEVLLKTLREYPLKPRQRLTIEYVMFKDVNDTADDLKRLPGLLRDIPSKVNLIPYNMNAGLGYHAPEHSNIDRWQKTLLDRGLTTTVRWSKGNDIDAACGQLATESKK